MAVWVEQSDAGKLNGEPVTVIPAKDGADDLTLLGRKAASHKANGWTVTWGADTFRAVKQRHGVRCVRRFWVD